ncbi:aminodeoxychorismate synthase component I [Saliterribacillus persicus]|uniref:Aminodeoxychorismate synthase subunit I /aminodeoxychorismate lyase apoprotein n=1 Tax=Saliterribacillus persicus TaxID=930114 RepID=A0A368XLU1_9BACI|nr:aminodeoxychorismate synthase component I [Saliterribacillus persicus]RCW67004.1 aminodeoxychorismate synthase subunit I /aminodeoxychorismate lyase apoprotein [Saliterribacillus persicus]
MTQPYLQFDFTSALSNHHHLSFSDPIEILQTSNVNEIEGIFLKIEQALEKGYYVAGFVSYEAAPAFDASYNVGEASNFPLVWFGVFHEPLNEEKHDSEPYQLSDWKLNTSFRQYEHNVKTIKAAIKRGDTYQVNYTTRMTSKFTGSSFDFYQHLQANQSAKYSAYLNIGNYQILSASPELFFEKSENKIMTKPMKGTAKRGKTYSEDLSNKKELAESEKDQAENLMIVDLLRNDLGRIALTDSIRVPKLYEIETYPTVHQMTSTIEADIDPDKKVWDWFKALFPCGSITGAPKIETMKFIKALENTPRNIYCGAIGYITPKKEAIFNVPIRTVLIDKEKKSATYGTGSGITWDSTPENEFDEIWTKAKLLTVKPSSFELLESILLENGTYPLLNFHLNRLEKSASYFQFKFNKEAVKSALNEQATNFKDGNFKIRLTLNKNGDIKLDRNQITPTDSGINAAFSSNAVHSDDIFLYHKTTQRDVYLEADENLPASVQTALLWNENEEVTEFTIGNVVVEKDNKFYTPPVNCGLLAGTFREKLLLENKITEQIITKEDVKNADTIWFINSVRGWVKVNLL